VGPWNRPGRSLAGGHERVALYPLCPRTRCARPPGVPGFRPGDLDAPGRGHTLTTGVISPAYLPLL